LRGALFVSVITSKDNQQLKTIRKLLSKRRDGLFVAEGEDLVDAAEAAGWEPVILLRAGVDVEPDLMPSGLGSGSRVVGVYEERWSEPHGDISVYLHGVHDPGNVGTIIRSAHALADGPVILGPECADPYGPKAVRASMGSIFARPPARAQFEALTGTTVALDHRAEELLAPLEPPIVLCVGGERKGLPDHVLDAASHRMRIPLHEDGPDSLNAAVAAGIGLWEATRMARNA
jgi:TrmH family RNA methyltransferase